MESCLSSVAQSLKKCLPSWPPDTYNRMSSMSKLVWLQTPGGLKRPMLQAHAPLVCCAGLEAASRAAQDQLAQFVAWLEDYEVEASREERVYSVWITSLLNSPLRSARQSVLSEDGVRVKGKVA